MYTRVEQTTHQRHSGNGTSAACFHSVGNLATPWRALGSHIAQFSWGSLPASVFTALFILAWTTVPAHVFAQEIHGAAENGDVVSLRRALAAGEDPETRDRAGRTARTARTALHIAAWKGHVSIAEALIEGGATVDARDRNRETPLHKATWDGVEPVIRFLVQKGAEVDATDLKGWTPLHWASWKGQTEVVKELVAQGASVALPGRDRVTPLHTAAIGGHANVVALLAENGASVNARTRDFTRVTPLEYALIGASLSEE